jgi:hypothetical protein
MYGGFMVAVMWAALGRRFPLQKIGMCAIAAYCIEELELFAVFNAAEFRRAVLPYNIWLLGLRLPMEILMIGGVLLIFRAQRFRFVRTDRSRAFSPSPTAPSA